MLTLLVGLVLVRVFTTGELRRITRSGAPKEEQVARVAATASVPQSMGPVLGILCAGEVLLEAPFLRDVWGLAGALAALLFRVAAIAVWLDAFVVAIDRLQGTTTPYGPRMASHLRRVITILLPRYALVGLAIQVLSEGRLTGVQVSFLYAGLVLVVVVLEPLLFRWGRATREPTPDEAATVRRLSASYGLRVDRFGVERDGRGGYVVGAGPGARIYIGEHVLAGPEDELAAVLAHEAGHRDHHHIAWRAAITAVSAVAMVVAAALLLATPAEGAGPSVALVVTACALPVVRYLALGVLRVRQEYDADAIAAARVGAEPMGRFLERHDDGIPLGGRGAWRFRLRTSHPTLAERLAALSIAAAR